MALRYRPTYLSLALITFIAGTCLVALSSCNRFAKDDDASSSHKSSSKSSKDKKSTAGDLDDDDDASASKGDDGDKGRKDADKATWPKDPDSQADDDAPVKCTAGSVESSTKVDITMTNLCPYEVDIWWVDFECRLIFYQTIASKDAWVGSTYVSHTWKIYKKGTKKLVLDFGIVNAEPTAQTFKLCDPEQSARLK